MKEQDDIEHLFKSEFEDFAVAPPAAVKESVDLSIAAARRKIFSRWFYIGLGLVVILFVTGVSLLDNEQKDVHLAKANAQNVSGNGDRSISSGTEEQKIASKNLSVQADSIDASGNSVKSADQVPGGKQNSKKASEKIKSKSKGKKLGSSGKNKTSVSKLGKNNAGFAEQESFAGNEGSANKKTAKIKRTKFKDKKPNKGKSLYSISGSGNPGSAEGKVPGKEKIFSGEEKRSSSEGQEAKATKTPETKVPEVKANEVKSPELKSTENKTVLTEKTPEKSIPEDSLTPYVEDDSTVFAKNEAREKDKMSKSFLFSLKSGTSLGFNQRKDTSSLMELKEKSSFFIQGEASWFFTPKLAITSGLNFESRKEILTGKVQSTDSIITGYNTEYMLDSLQNPVDSVLVPVYGSQTSTTTLQNSYKLYNIGLPVFFTYSKELGSKLNLDLSAGAILSLQGSKIVSETFNQNTVVVNKFGAKACLRAQLRYQFSSWGVSLNTNFGYDFIPVNSWPGIERNRTYLDLGIGIHYVIGK